MALYTIRLEDVRIRAYHGVMPQENIVGTEFRVDVSLDVTIPYPDADELGATVSYADVYEIVLRHMHEPKKLLETVAWGIGEEIRQRFPIVTDGSIKITKLSPPIAGMQGRASVEMKIF